MRPPQTRCMRRRHQRPASGGGVTVHALTAHGLTAHGLFVLCITDVKVYILGARSDGARYVRPRDMRRVTAHGLRHGHGLTGLW